MKKLVSLLAAAALCFSLVACGGGSSSSAPAGGNNAVSTPAAGGDAADAELTPEDIWPSGTTVYVDVPSAAGGGTDIYTRYLTQALTEVCPGVNFVVQNFDTGEVAMEDTKNADPDGKHLFVYHGGGIVQYLCGSSNVSMKDDMKVVGIASMGGPQAIIAGPDAPYHNFAELATYIKEHPGEVMIGCSLGGTTQMIFVSLVNAMTGNSEDATYVQCANEADKLTQTASGGIDIANCSIPNAVDWAADGRLTILGTIGPDVSTLDAIKDLTGLDLGDEYLSGPEQGFDSAVWNSNYYLLGPAGLPDNIAKAINAAVQKAVVVDSYIEGNKQMASFTGVCDYDTTVQMFNDEWAFMDNLTTEMGLKTR